MSFLTKVSSVFLFIYFFYFGKQNLISFEKIIGQYKKFSKIKKEKNLLFLLKKSVISHSSSSHDFFFFAVFSFCSFLFFLLHLFRCSHSAISVRSFSSVSLFSSYLLPFDFCLLFLVYVQLMSLLIYILLFGLCVTFRAFPPA